MKRAVAGLLLLAGAGAADAQARIRFSEIERATPALAERLLGERVENLAEARADFYPGVAQWSGASVLFAHYPVPTGLADLCLVEMHAAQLDFVEPRERDAELVVAHVYHYRSYVLTRNRPSFAPRPDRERQAAQCRAQSPVLAGPAPPLAEIAFNGTEPTPEQAAFGYRAIIAARRARNVRTAGCLVTADPRCAEPRTFLRDLDLRRIGHIGIEACRSEGQRLCVTIWLPGSLASSLILIETDRAVGAPLGGPIRVRSVQFSAQFDPVA